jgi:ABC-type phosphate/phosphonate transport system permease subunit
LSLILAAAFVAVFATVFAADFAAVFTAALAIVFAAALATVFAAIFAAVLAAAFAAARRPSCRLPYETVHHGRREPMSARRRVACATIAPVLNRTDSKER